uniref:Kinetochore protein Nuf2 N-terminal domain-containing protein n=1 Tax=Arcella intermedia TaxID=1963864 RepID=A0A6B2L4M9_9EUKA
MHQFPILEEKEILRVLCVKDANYDCLFNEPMDGAKVTSAYKFIVAEIVKEIIIEEESTDGLNSALHKQSFHDLAFLKILLDLMRAADISDFSSRDLNFPSPQRTRRNLSALLNLMYFVGGIREEYCALTEPTNGIAQERSAQCEETNLARKQYNELLSKYNQEAAQREVIVKEIEKMKEVGQELAMKAASLTEHCQNKNAVFNEMEKKKVAIKERIQELGLKNEQSRKRIIISPDKKIYALQQMKQMIQTLSFANSELELNLQDTQQQLKAACKEESDLKKYEALLNENIYISEQIRSLESQLFSTKQEHEQVNQEIKQKQDLQMKLRNSIAEISKSIEEKENSQLYEIKEKWNVLKCSVKEKEFLDNQKRARMKEKLANQNKLQQQKESMLNQQKETIQALQNMEKQLDLALETYKDKFINIMNEMKFE